MRRLVILFLLSLTAAGAYACGGASPAPDTAAAAAGEVCPLLDAGPPPLCPDGCVWNGTECRKQGGIIIYDAHARDGGARPPVK